MSYFEKKDEYEKWIERQDWYQTIILPSGLKTSGKVSTDQRESFFKKIDFKNKSVLDVGCNSGQYCFWAKDCGAQEVVGIDINSKRIEQAKTLAENEKYEIEFKNIGIFELESLRKKFDVVLCIAVVTEISDLFGAIENLKKVIGHKCYLELDLAKPLVYLSKSKNWLRGYSWISRQKALFEVRKTNNGSLILSPTIEILREIFGKEYKIQRTSGGIRYDMVEITKIKS